MSRSSVCKPRSQASGSTLPHLLTEFRTTLGDGTVLREQRCNWCGVVRSS